jgi:hypothetical protein
MESNVLERAVALGNRLGQAFVLTVDGNSAPHLASAGRMEALGDQRISISEWFCPGTLSNLQVNPRISVVVWDPAEDTGFQMVGESEGVTEEAMMDGFTGEAGEGSPLPQVERTILVRVEKVLHFSHAPHSDLEEQS